MSAPILEVRWWDGSVVGYLANRGTVYFAYHDAWLKRGHNLSPLNLAFTATAFNGAKGVEGLPGLIADCLPDAWGRRVAQSNFAKHELGELTALKLLAWRGARGLGALQFYPEIGDDDQPRNARLAAVTASALARGAIQIQRGKPSKVLSQLVYGGTAGGAFPKALVLAYPDGTLSVGQPDGVGVPSLLKLDLSRLGGLAEREHAYALMSAAAGIRSVSTSLIQGQKTTHHLLVRRFDIPDQRHPQRRLHFHSLSRLLHQDPGALDYSDLFRAAIQLGAPLADLREIARRMLFNVLAANADDHGKNHAFAYEESSRTWSLTPAFDLNFQSGILDRGMKVSGEVWPKLGTMEAMCLEVGIAREEFRAIVDQVDAAVAGWMRFAKAVQVPDALAREAAAGHKQVRAAVMSAHLG